MKTTALILSTFFLVLPGPTKLVNTDKRTGSEFNSFRTADNSLNFSNYTPKESAISKLSESSTEKKNSAVAAKPSQKLVSSPHKSLNLELLFHSGKELNTEKWMTEINEFNKDASVFKENDIQIEEWMTSDLANPRENNIIKEQVPDLEDWMNDLGNWKEKSSEFPVTQQNGLETDLSIENWMIDSLK